MWIDSYPKAISCWDFFNNAIICFSEVFSSMFFNSLNLSQSRSERISDIRRSNRLWAEIFHPEENVVGVGLGEGCKRFSSCVEHHSVLHVKIFMIRFLRISHLWHFSDMIKGLLNFAPRLMCIVLLDRFGELLASFFTRISRDTMQHK